MSSVFLVDAGRTGAPSPRAACRALAMLCALTTWIAPPSTAAQSMDAVFKGMVTDSTGAGVAGATVTVKNLDTGLVDLVTTDGNGLYRSALLPAGPVASLGLAEQDYRPARAA